MFSFCLSFLLVWGENPLSFQFLFTRPHFHFCCFSVISYQVYHTVLWDTVSGAARSIWSMLCPLYMQRHYDALCAVSILSSMLLSTWTPLDCFGGDDELLVCCLPWCLQFLAELSHYIGFNCKINFTFIFWSVLFHVCQWYLQLCSDMNPADEERKVMWMPLKQDPESMIALPHA